MEIRQVVAELFHADRPKDRQTWHRQQSLFLILRTCLKIYGTLLEQVEVGTKILGELAC